MTSIFDCTSLASEHGTRSIDPVRITKLKLLTKRTLYREDIV